MSRFKCLLFAAYGFAATLIVLNATYFAVTGFAAEVDESAFEQSSSIAKGTAMYYAAQVEKELGPLPRFSCDDAIEIPITQNGERVTGKRSVDWCDKPAAFGDPCQIGNRVGRVYGTHHDGSPRPEVVYMMFCRDGGMGVIGHNSETGATAFFSIEVGANADGFVPGPRDPWYEKTWQSPAVVAADNCFKCHMADPFLHTPWIDQVRDPDDPSKPLVPLIADEDSPYWLIGDEFPEPVEQPWIGELQGNRCVKCHKAQCVPDFFNFPLDELKMPPPFDEMHYADDPELDAHREELRVWCKLQEIVYFESSKKKTGNDKDQSGPDLSKEELIKAMKAKGMTDVEISEYLKSLGGPKKVKDK